MITELQSSVIDLFGLVNMFFWLVRRRRVGMVDSQQPAIAMVSMVKYHVIKRSHEQDKNLG